MKELSPLSKLALELCENLGVSYSLGKGYATLDGVALDTLACEPLFNLQYSFQGQVEVSPMPYSSERYRTASQTECGKEGFACSLRLSLASPYKVNPEWLLTVA